MRWGFIVDITDCTGSQITKKVLDNAKEAITSIPPVDLDDRIPSYKASIIFFQSSDRWLKEDPGTPREDRGDLDNLIKLVIDGLGPIIGFRKSWKKVNNKWVSKNSNKPADSRILNLYAKKINSGSISEMVSVEIETLV